MLNKKVIVISGFSRGGTNILWNILQSHPEICSAIYETGTLFRNRDRVMFARIVAILQKAGIIDGVFSRRIIDFMLFRWKMKNHQHIDNRFKFADNRYTRKEVAATALCLKSVDKDIELTDLLLKTYPDLYFIALTRNGYALANGHLRRGSSLDDFIKLHKILAEKMNYYSGRVIHFKQVKFEDILDDPFQVARALYEFTNVTPVELPKLRLKSKKILTVSGDHIPSFKTEHRKYWFDRNEIREIIDPTINRKQIAHLDPAVVTELNSMIGSEIKDFGYSIID